MEEWQVFQSEICLGVFSSFTNPIDQLKLEECIVRRDGLSPYLDSNQGSFEVVELVLEPHHRNFDIHGN